MVPRDELCRAGARTGSQVRQRALQPLHPALSAHVVRNCEQTAAPRVCSTAVGGLPGALDQTCQVSVVRDDS